MDLLNTKEIFIKDKTSIILGNFDGVHLAHQKLFCIAKKRAKQEAIKSLAFTFNPHPLAFFSGNPFKAITTPNEKRRLLSQLGIDCIVEYPFDNETSEMEPQQFFKEILMERLNARVISVGENHRFGKGRTGDNRLLFELCEKFDIELNIMQDMFFNKEVISSTTIRKHISEHRLEEAKSMLGGPYFISGEIASGKAFGRSIGFPTINFKTEDAKLYPTCGVYATQTEINGGKYKSITNIGNNPTVGGTEIKVETHIFDFNADVYNQEAVVYFHKWIRDEKKFDTIQELSSQIETDIKEAYMLFNEEGLK